MAFQDLENRVATKAAANQVPTIRAFLDLETTVANKVDEGDLESFPFFFDHLVLDLVKRNSFSVDSVSSSMFID